MKIAINDNRKIVAIQEEFNKVFPYLKLEFFSRSHKAGSGSAKKYIESRNLSLGEFRTLHTKKNMTITPDMTVRLVEQGFKEYYGLNIQVFRKSGKVWLETTVTDGWTLEEQNLQGESLSKDVA